MDGLLLISKQNSNLQRFAERNVLCRFCGGECLSIQEVIECTEMNYTKPQPDAKNGIRTKITEQKQQEVYETELITQQCQPV